METPLFHHIGLHPFSPLLWVTVLVLGAAGLSSLVAGVGTGHLPRPVWGHLQLFLGCVPPGGVHSLPCTFAGTVQVGMGKGTWVVGGLAVWLRGARWALVSPAALSSGQDARASLSCSSKDAVWRLADSYDVKLGYSLSSRDVRSLVVLVRCKHPPGRSFSFYYFQTMPFGERSPSKEDPLHPRSHTPSVLLPCLCLRVFWVASWSLGWSPPTGSV